MFCLGCHEFTNYVTVFFATKAGRHKVARRLSFISVDDFYFSKGPDFLLHERVIIPFPKSHFYILHSIFYILHFLTTNSRIVSYRGELRWLRLRSVFLATKAGRHKVARRNLLILEDNFNCSPLTRERGWG